jgi:hypothetical protein
VVVIRWYTKASGTDKAIKGIRQKPDTDQKRVQYGNQGTEKKVSKTSNRLRKKVSKTSTRGKKSKQNVN